MFAFRSLSPARCRGCGHAPGLSRRAFLAARKAQNIHTTASNQDDETSSSPRIRRQASASANDDIQRLASESPAPDRPRQQLIRRTVIEGSSASPPSEVKRRSDFGSRGLRDRGRARGRGRGAGRGRRRGGGPSNDDEYGEDEAGEEEEELPAEEELGVYHAEDFIDGRDLQGYQFVTTRLSRAMGMEDEAASKMKEGREKGDTEMVKQAEALQEAIPAQLKQALQAVQDTEEEVLPRHAPTNVQEGVLKGQLGGVPVGRDGTGGAIEESLRALVNRPHEIYRDPRILAEKAFAGELVKFNNAFEKAKVEERLMSMANTIDASEEDRARSRVKPLSEDGRRAVVERLVSGQYEDVKGAGFKSEMLKRAAQYTSGSWTAGSRDAFLNTIERLMPVAKPTSQVKRS
ncbi:MAG: hypothetical protein M1828_001107 [Chrysothrix sp. TS-e1954]|nr:MAG: hypothetical protein M1828_001107 [Chrysothrix sp. TS-e1954]